MWWSDGGKDTLDGGAGDDVLAGGKGGDLYLFGRGAGQDRIAEEGGDADAILLGAGVAPGGVLLSRGGWNNDDLLLTVADTGDRLTVQGHFARAWWGEFAG